MHLETVESSMIYAVGYDPEMQELTVVFNSGRVFWYENVPSRVHQELMSAGSKGKHMRDYIIDLYPTHDRYPYCNTI